MFASNAAAQVDTTRVPTGVRLSTVYQVMKRPAVAVRPVAGAHDLGLITQSITTILNRDLEFSDRFEVVQTPQALAAGPLDYSQWNSLNVVYVVAAELLSTSSGYALSVTLHDVPFATTKQTQAFAVPGPADPGYRMAIHAISDEVVRWIAGEPGAAASRILFTRRTPGFGADIYVVDSDGEDLRRVVQSPGFIYSPTWSPDGRKIAYSVRTPDFRVQLKERDLVTGQERVLMSSTAFAYTPSYSPDGKRIAFSYAIGSGSEIFDLDLERRGAPRRLTRGPGADVGPSYSADGRQIVFQSDRLGQRHIFVAAAEGGEATEITPFAGHRVAFNAPDWSPTSTELAFHGESKGGMQLMIADARRPLTSVSQITEAGESQDPTWAPDGRHLAFSGVRDRAAGLYLIDKLSGRTRIIYRGAIEMPDWSGRLAVARPVSPGN